MLENRGSYLNRNKSELLLQMLSTDNIDLDIMAKKTTDKYEYGVIERYSVLKKEKNPTLRAEALVQMADIAWEGGDAVQGFVAKYGMLRYITTLLTDTEESEAVKVAGLKALSLICRLCKNCQEEMYEIDGLEYLQHCLSSKYLLETRMWATHAILSTLVGCGELLEESTLELNSIFPLIEELSTKKEWAEWGNNDAQDVLKYLLGIRHFAEKERDINMELSKQEGGRMSYNWESLASDESI
eukprot:Nk52_evm26s222 gene=Nk52_evmTU26s222